MKKFSAFLLTFIMLLSVIPMSVFAEDYNNFYNKRICNDYISYKNGHRYKFNYAVNKIFVTLNDDFWEEHDKIDASLFPEIADKIEKIVWTPGNKNGIIYFHGYDNTKRPTEQQVDDFIVIVKYFQTLSFIYDIRLERDWSWDIFDNYNRYKENNRIKFAYIINKANVRLSDDFWESHDKIDSSVFPEIADKIESIDWLEGSKAFNIYFYGYDDNKKATEQEIDDFIAVLNYLRTVPSVVEVTLDYNQGIDIYDNYAFYSPDTYRYGEGFVITAATVSLSEGFCEEHDTIDASLFPEIADKAVNIVYKKNFHLCSIEFVENPYEKPSKLYTEKDIDDFLEIIEYLNTISFVMEALPGRILKPGDPDSTEPLPPTDYFDIPTSDTTGADTKAPETKAPETTAAENKPVNDPTGDNLFFAVSTAFVACAALCTAVIVKRKKYFENR